MPAIVFLFAGMARSYNSPVVGWARGAHAAWPDSAICSNSTSDEV